MTTSAKGWILVTVALVVVGLWLPPGEATTYYVAPSGQDSHSCAQAQSPAQAKATISAGARCLASGDTLQVASGRYQDDVSDVLPSGTTQARTTLRAAPGATVTVVGTSKDCVLFTRNKRYLHVEGIDLEGPVTGFGLCIQGEGGHLLFRDMKISRMRNQGMLQGNSQEYNVFERLEVFANGSADRRAGFQHGLYLGSGIGHIVRDSIIRDNLYGYGIQYWEPPRNVTIENTVFRNNRQHLYVAGHGAIVRNNVFDTSQLNGVVLASPNVQFHHNAITGAKECGVVMNEGATAQVLNNIWFGNRRNLCTPKGTHRNNLDTDPRWVAPDAGDFRLRDGSPARNAGAFLPNVPTDMRGVSRARDTVDLGPLEGMGAAPPAPARVLSTE